MLNGDPAAQAAPPHHCQPPATMHPPTGRGLGCTSRRKLCAIVTSPGVLLPGASGPGPYVGFEMFPSSIAAAPVDSWAQRGAAGVVGARDHPACPASCL